jgi:hypothetical protein
MDYVITIDNLLLSLLIANFTTNMTIQYYFATIQLHYKQLVTNASDSKDKIPKINQLHFHLIH